MLFSGTAMPTPTVLERVSMPTSLPAGQIPSQQAINLFIEA